MQSLSLWERPPKAGEGGVGTRQAALTLTLSQRERE